jgi:hypothetical protein
LDNPEKEEYIKISPTELPESSILVPIQYWYQSKVPRPEIGRDLPLPPAMVATMEMEPEYEVPPVSNDIVTSLIDSDRFKSPQERRLDRESYEQYGWFQKSASQVVDDSKVVQELHLYEEKDKNKTEDQILSEIKLDHLEPSIREEVLKLCKEHINLFSTGPLDVGKCNNMEATFEVNPNIKRRFSQKYIPVPLRSREQCKAILKQFEEAGIIEPYKSNIPPPHVQNLIIGKKKDGKPRALLDCRLSNLYTLKAVCTQIGRAHV